MRLSRLYTAQSLKIGNGVALTGDTAHYINKVLRLKAGESLSLFNAEEGEFLAQINAVQRNCIDLQLLESVPCNANPELEINLGIGLSRGDRMDYSIQKATELGATSIIPLLTQRCEVKLDQQRGQKKLDHWQKIAISASEQCGRTQVPIVQEITSIAHWLSARPGGRCIMLDHRSEMALAVTDRPSSINLCVGSEGGFSDEEINLAQKSDWELARLGPRVLRTETAPMAALAVLQFMYGQL